MKTVYIEHSTGTSRRCDWAAELDLTEKPQGSQHAFPFGNIDSNSVHSCPPKRLKDNGVPLFSSPLQSPE